jgi:subtilisin family serine protease
MIVSLAGFAGAQGKNPGARQSMAVPQGPAQNKVAAVPNSLIQGIPAAQSKSPVFIVALSGDPVIAYDGGVPGLAGTRPAKGKKINPNSRKVKNYVAYLARQQDSVLRDVGAGSDSKVYGYHYSFNGFAALLSLDQVAALQGHPEVLRVWRDERRQLNTDSTPDYLGLTGEGGVWDTYGKGEDIIIGVLDTGVWPEHPSFSEQVDFSDAPGKSGRKNLAYGPPPADWFGSCQSGERWSQNDCNNKIIGARYYVAGFGHGSSGILPSEFLSARDSDGHGSHVASTAGGNEGPINDITHLPVSGMAPRARLAIYKVCWDDIIDPNGGGCFSSDSAAAIDQAVADGVDVINFSIGGSSTFFGGPDDIAFLFAADAGVWVATSNGNDGPGAQTTGTPAGVPWITAVGASQDNEVFAPVVTVNEPGSVAGDYEALEGSSPVQLADVGPITEDVVNADPADGCTELTNPGDMAGKIALVIRGTCSFTTKYNAAAAAGAVAIIVYNDGTNSGRIDPISMFAPGTTIPGVMIGFNDGDALWNAVGVNATLPAEATDSRENRIAGFSSRGPNGGAPDIIKPDVAAPGVEIIAAETLEPNANAGGGTLYQSISGTSMASPHVAGLFALMKEAHPDWSAAQAKSAVMTSARKNLKKTFGDDDADPFDIGAGAIVPAGAFDPGLVYDAGFFDYLAFLCGEPRQSALVSQGTCDFLAGEGFSLDPSDLNIASIGIAEFVGNQTVTRTVTSVSPDGTEFTVVVEAPDGIDVVVNPTSFTLNEGDSQMVEIEFSTNSETVVGEWTFGALTWENDADASEARSPIAIRPVQISTDAEVVVSGTEGSAEISVTFGYTGVYMAELSGLAEAIAVPGNVSAAEGLDVLCADLPALDYLRFATFDEDTTTPGADDIDLRLFLLDNCTDFNILEQLGSSGGFTSEEVIDVANAPAGGYAFVIDYFAAASGSDIDYTAFIYPVLGDEGNAVLNGVPASATAGDTVTETVDYTGLNADSRYLGVVSHQDGGGEIARTVVDVDTQ